MAVPMKYRQIGDFHEYYSGKRTAPYLTIFIGGNHEASNHLFELYYGGWVAPNIYYLGAANVLRYGPLRIAGLSGIYKGYDYKKPHYERLPYNENDKRSIFHVRETDVRKLLQIRTQVDLGLSHDWPRGIEYSGDYDTLFRKKRDFRKDSEQGHLGSLGAKYVLDRLRPAHWFSAHLHVKFTGSIQHGEYTPNGQRPQPTSQSASSQPPKTPYMFGMDGATVSRGLSNLMDMEEQKPEGDQSFSAHTGNGASNTKAAALNSEPTTPNTEATTFNPEMTTLNPEATAFDPSLGEKTSVSVAQQTPENGSQAEISTQNTDQGRNDLSQQGLGDTKSRISAWNNFHNVAASQEAAENSRFLLEQSKTQEAVRNLKHNLTWRQVDIDQDGMRRRLAVEGSESGDRPESKKQKTQHDSSIVKNADEIDLDLSDSDQETPAQILGGTEAEATAQDSENSKNIEGVPEDIRNQLPASFARPEPALQPAQNAPMNEPLPEAISNKTTQFLALDKCQDHREFLQLLKLDPISEQDSIQPQRPYRLQYDKEWLAISRVFANELHLGDPKFNPPPDKGDAVYKPQIVEAEKWIEENVVKPGKLDVPENFTITAPIYDESVPITTQEMPPEYSNPQTAQFCELIGIENKFHASDEERQARAAAGPRPSDFDRPMRRGFGHGRGHGGGRGRGNRRSNRY